MAKDAARRRKDANGSSKQQRREVGTHGSSWGRNKRADPNVRRQNRLETDGRLVRAREAQERHEAELRALEAQVNGTPHTPYQQQIHDYVERTTREQGVPFHVEDPETIKKVAALWVPERKKETPVVDTPPVRETEPAPISWSVSDARGLIKQGYHIERVVKLTGVPVEQLKSLVGSDGYARGL